MAAKFRKFLQAPEAPSRGFFFAAAPCYSGLTRLRSRGTRLWRFPRARIALARSSGLAHAVEYPPQDARPARRSDRCAAPHSARPRRPRCRERGEACGQENPECFALQAFGDWKGVATNTQAGARIGQISFADADSCDLRGEISVADSYDAKLVLYGAPDGTPLPKDFLVKPENRLIAKNEDGSIAVDEPLCGVCTGIRDDKVSIVMPLSAGALFRADKSVDMTVKLGDAKACGFTLNCEDLRKALDWAKEKKRRPWRSRSRTTNARRRPKAASSPRPVARCSASPTIASSFARFAAIAMRASPPWPAATPPSPRIIFWRPRSSTGFLQQDRAARLLSVYARFILPSAIAARLQFNALAYRLYARMMSELARDFAPEILIASVAPPSDTPSSPSRAHCRSRATCRTAKPPHRLNQAKVAPQSALTLMFNKSERFAANGVQSKTRDADRGLAAGLRDAGGVDLMRCPSIVSTVEAFGASPAAAVPAAMRGRR